MDSGKTPLREGMTVTVEIEKLAYGGAGFARVQGMAFFVQRALPGQVVEAVVERVKKRFAEGRLVAVVKPSGREVKPLCSHFAPEKGRACGGCDFQDLAYDEQLHWKRVFVTENLRFLGGTEPEVAPCQASPLVRGFRNKMEFAFAGQGRKLGLGLKPRGEGQGVVNVADCVLMQEPAMEIVEAVREFARACEVASWDSKTGNGFWRHLVLRQGREGRWMALLITAPDTAKFDLVEELALSLRERFDDLSVVHGTRQDRVALARCEELREAWGEPALMEELVGVKYRLSPDSFFQVNPGGAQLLVQAVLDACGDVSRETVWDCYCGVGSLSLPLARIAGQVIGFELDEAAIENAMDNAGLNTIVNCSFLSGDMGETLATKELPRPGVVVTDPPRGGMDETVVKRLLEIAPRRIVYVSCNPTTLARDAKELGGRYRLARVTPVDMFPYTHHVESVAVFERTE